MYIIYDGLSTQNYILLHIWKFTKIHDYFIQKHFRPILYSVKSLWRAEVIKTCIHFSKTNFCFKFTWSFTLWFYTFKLSNNTIHFCACQLKTRESFIVFINHFKTFRWNFFPFEIIQDQYFSPHSCSRFTMIEHIITAKNFRMSFSNSETFSVKINIPSFYNSNALVPSASEAGAKYFRQIWKCLSKEI